MNLNSIAEEIVVCTRCDLHKSRRRAVPGEGSGKAKIMLVGEAPGKEEDALGKPFVGRSGKVLNDILEKAGLKREELFITSVVKCRPPQNRTPRKKEMNVCVQAHLRRQIEVISPKIICLLGGVAAKALLGKERVSEVRGKFFLRGPEILFPTYHPAAAGRKRSWRYYLREDLKRLRILNAIS
jgi:uracil-DNA glycosylase family 4